MRSVIYNTCWHCGTQWAQGCVALTICDACKRNGHRDDFSSQCEKCCEEDMQRIQAILDEVKAIGQRDEERRLRFGLEEE
jgi:hypothetical protein